MILRNTRDYRGIVGVRIQRRGPIRSALLSDRQCRQDPDDLDFSAHVVSDLNEHVAVRWQCPNRATRLRFLR